MLVEAATTAVRDPDLGRFTAQQVAQRRGPKVARVALARRLLTLCSDALRDKDGCRAYPAPRGRSRQRGPSASVCVMACSTTAAAGLIEPPGRTTPWAIPPE
jgi:hypothetical protein